MIRNPPLPANRQSTVEPLREGRVRKGGRNIVPSQIKVRPPAPGAIPQSPSTMPTGAIAPGAHDTTDRS